MILSPRVVHFCQKQMFWECSELQACETIPDRPLHNGATKLSVHDLGRYGTELSGAQNDKYQLWAKLVNFYTRGDLTFKTMAIMGVAKSIGLPTDEYLAGLWTRGLAEQLNWQVERDEDGNTLASRSTEYRAPSWSWASMDGRIICTYPISSNSSRTCVKILQTRLVPANPNEPMGPVLRGGFIQLETMLAVAQLRVRTLADRFRVKSHYQLNGIVDVRILLDEGKPIEGEVYYCVPTNNEFRLSGILVRPTGHKPGEYTREGSFDVLVHSDNGEKFWELCRTFGNTTREEEGLWERKVDGDSEDGIQMFVVTII